MIAEVSALVRCATYAAYTLSLTSTDHTNKAFRWFKNVEVGQMVIEASTMYDRKRDWCAVGRLVNKTQEPFPNLEWDEEEDGPPPTETCWYIECLEDGTLYRWTNADFLRVPEEVNPWRDW